jgi:mannitol 2-dehydrogenase
VADVEPYKVMKTRLLNASHSAMGYLGYLAGYRTTAEAMGNPVFAEYVATLMSTDIAPLLPRIEGVDVDGYQRTLLERFANPDICDELTRLCGRGSIKMPAYLLPSVVAARKAGGPVSLLTVAIAAWFCYLAGQDLDGRPIEITDVRKADLQRLVRGAGDDPRRLLQDRSIFGALADDREFAALLEETVRDLREFGPFGAIVGSLAADLLDVA